MIYLFSIWAMVFVCTGLFYLKRDDRDGSAMFMFVLAGYMQALLIIEVITQLKG